MRSLVNEVCTKVNAMRADLKFAWQLQIRAKMAIAASSQPLSTIRAEIRCYPGHFSLQNAGDSRISSDICHQGKYRGVADPSVWQKFD
jgi:hypothetical protein